MPHFHAIPCSYIHVIYIFTHVWLYSVVYIIIYIYIYLFLYWCTCGYNAYIIYIYPGSPDTVFNIVFPRTTVFQQPRFSSEQGFEQPMFFPFPWVGSSFFHCGDTDQRKPRARSLGTQQMICLALEPAAKESNSETQVKKNTLPIVWFDHMPLCVSSSCSIL